MIVRINQLDPAAAEQASGWETGAACEPGTARGPIERAWDAGTYVYQVLILERDEQHQLVPSNIRQDQVRQMLPNVIDALTTPDDHIVLRIDGAFTPNGIAPAFAFAADPERCQRFSFSAVDRLADREGVTIASIRIFPRPDCIAELCADPKMSLHGSVRLRAFAMPADLVDPLLDTADLDDERWRELLPSAAFMVSTSCDLMSLLIWTPRFDADEARSRITGRLGGKQSNNGNPSTAGQK